MTFYFHLSIVFTKYNKKSVQLVEDASYSKCVRNVALQLLPWKVDSNIQKTMNALRKKSVENLRRILHLDVNAIIGYQLSRSTERFIFGTTKLRRVLKTGWENAGLGSILLAKIPSGSCE
jgi:hypothetical protein